MLKNIARAAVSAILGSSLLIASGAALAQATCTVNGKEVPCEQVAQTAKKFAGIGLVLVIIGIAATIFWIVMLVHAASNPIENKAMWIILMIFTGIIGALIYYFAVKRKFKS